MLTWSLVARKNIPIIWIIHPFTSSNTVSVHMPLPVLSSWLHYLMVISFMNIADYWQIIKGQSMLLWKESFSSDGQPIPTRLNSLNIKKTSTYDIINPDIDLGQAHKCGGVECALSISQYSFLFWLEYIMWAYIYTYISHLLCRQDRTSMGKMQVKIQSSGTMCINNILWMSYIAPGVHGNKPLTP